MPQLTISAHASPLAYTFIAIQSILLSKSSSLTLSIDTTQKPTESFSLILDDGSIQQDAIKALQSLLSLVYPEATSSTISAIHTWIEFISTQVTPAVSFANFTRVLDHVDDTLAFRTFLVGHQISIADLSIWGSLKGLYSIFFVHTRILILIQEVQSYKEFSKRNSILISYDGIPTSNLWMNSKHPSKQSKTQRRHLYVLKFYFNLSTNLVIAKWKCHFPIRTSRGDQRTSRDSIPTRALRISPHWPRQSRHRQRVLRSTLRGHASPPLRRHQRRKGTCRVPRIHHC